MAPAAARHPPRQPACGQVAPRPGSGCTAEFARREGPVLSGSLARFGRSPSFWSLPRETVVLRRNREHAVHPFLCEEREISHNIMRLECIRDTKGRAYDGPGFYPLPPSGSRSIEKPISPAAGNQKYFLTFPPIYVIVSLLATHGYYISYFSRKNRKVTEPDVCASFRNCL